MFGMTFPLYPTVDGWIFYDNVLILSSLKVAKSIFIIEIEMRSDYSVY